MASVQKVTVILDGNNTWHDWLEVVKTKARAGKIWEYIDPPMRFEGLLNLGYRSYLILGRVFCHLLTSPMMN